MSPALQRTLALWAALLSAVLCLTFLPISRALAVVLMLACWALIIVVLATRRRPMQETVLSADDLPDASYRQPVVLVCGDSVQAWPQGSSVLTVPHGCWVRVTTPLALDVAARQLLALRPEWGRQLSVMVNICPQQHQDNEVLTSRLLALRWQIGQLRRETGYSLPLLLIGHAGSAMVNEPLWQVVLPGEPVRVWRDNTAPCTLSSWLTTGGRSAVHQQLLMNRLSEWFQQHVEAVFTRSDPDTPPLFPVCVAWGLSRTLDGALPTSLWKHGLQQHTGLNQVAGWNPAEGPDLSLPFPACVLPLLPKGSGLTPRQRALRYGLGLFVLAGIAALFSSGWNNGQLVRRIVFDISHYQRIAMNDDVLKTAAVAVLLQDAAELDSYTRNGVPLRFGLGLYQGGRLYLPLREAIRSYVPLPAPPLPAVELPPKTVRLDSLSLFDSGKAVLKPGSLKMLVSAVVDIKARPGWLIVVAGHTDSTGHAQTNQQLSLKRAEALRDWMLSTSDVSPACFAVQGYGATRPVATNTTPEGRALNRRVEISLVPQADACRSGDAETQPVHPER